MARAGKSTKPGSAAGPGKSLPSGSGATPPRGLLVSVLRWAMIVAIWSGVALGGLVAWYAYDLPDLEKLETHARRASITLLATDGSVLASYGDLYGGTVRFDDLPPFLVQAIVARRRLALAKPLAA